PPTGSAIGTRRHNAQTRGTPDRLAGRAILTGWGATATRTPPNLQTQYRPGLVLLPQIHDAAAFAQRDMLQIGHTQQHLGGRVAINDGRLDIAGADAADRDFIKHYVVALDDTAGRAHPHRRALAQIVDAEAACM